MSESFPQATVESLAGEWKGSIKIGPFGSQLKREEMVEHGHKVYGQENVIANDWSLGDRRVSGAKFNALRSCELHPGDVVVSMMGTVGKCAVFPPDAEPGLMDSHLLRIQPNPKLVTREFLATVLQAENVVGGQVASMSHGSIMAGLSSSIVRRFTVPLPPLNEQPILSAILDTIDTTIRQTEAIIEKLKLVKQGLLHDLLTRGIDANGELRPPQSQAPQLYKDSPLGWIPKAWAPHVLGQVLIGGTRNGLYKPSSFHGTGPLMVQMGGMFRGEAVDFRSATRVRVTRPELNAFGLEVGDLLFARRSLTFEGAGQCAIVRDLPEASTYESSIVRARVDRSRVEPEFAALFLRGALSSTHRRTLIRQVAVSGVSSDDILHFLIALPDLTEQAAIIASIASAQHCIEQEATELRKLSLQKAGLMDDLLTGRVRVTPLLQAAPPVL